MKTVAYWKEKLDKVDVDLKHAWSAYWGISVDEVGSYEFAEEWETPRTSLSPPRDLWDSRTRNPKVWKTYRNLYQTGWVGAQKILARIRRLERRKKYIQDQIDQRLTWWNRIAFQ